ncbi:MAG: SLATT domain-containing protein [Waterburya sp.]
MNISLSPSDVECKTQRTKLIASMKTTAVNRYNASNRLIWQSKVTFSVSTLFSLGLIFVPLMQLAKAPLAMNGDVLSAIQIFLAVAILVYSIITGTARFEIRSEQLNDCGDKIKSLIRELRIAPENEEKEASLLRDFQKQYEKIIADVENHDRSDYLLTIVRSPDLFILSFPGRVFWWLKYCCSSLVSYLPALALVVIEILLITDMFGITKIFSPYLNTPVG